MPLGVHLSSGKFVYFGLVLPLVHYFSCFSYSFDCLLDLPAGANI